MRTEPRGRLLPRCIPWAAALYLIHALALLAGWGYPRAGLRAEVYAALPEMIAPDALLLAGDLAAAALLLRARRAREDAQRLARLAGWGFGAGLLGTLGHALLRFLLTGLSPLGPALLVRAAAQLALVGIALSGGKEAGDAG